MTRISFDIDALRSFSTGIDLGSFVKAADRLNRSTSAVSAQLKKLEQQAGTPLVRKAGRGVALTEAGETMLAYARRLLDLNDEAASAMRGADLHGRVRLGLQEDFGEQLLPEVLGRFARAHPKLRIEVRIARSTELLDSVSRNRTDLALAWVAGATSAHAEHVGRWPMRWVGPTNPALSNPDRLDEPLPLAVLEAPCAMRSAATEALDRAGIAWRVAFSSASLAGIWAAVTAGLGVSVRTPLGLPGSVQALTAKEADLPALPVLNLALHRPEATISPAVEQLAQLIRQQLSGATSG